MLINSVNASNTDGADMLSNGTARGDLNVTPLLSAIPRRDADAEGDIRVGRNLCSSDVHRFGVVECVLHLSVDEYFPFDRLCCSSAEIEYVNVNDKRVADSELAPFKRTRCDSQHIVHVDGRRRRQEDGKPIGCPRTESTNSFSFSSTNMASQEETVSGCTTSAASIRMTNVSVNLQIRVGPDTRYIIRVKP